MQGEVVGEVVAEPESETVCWSSSSFDPPPASISVEAMYRGWRVISYFPWRPRYDDPGSAAMARVETAINDTAPAITDH